MLLLFSAKFLWYSSCSILFGGFGYAFRFHDGTGHFGWNILFWVEKRRKYDSDVIYDEALIPHYELPELLVTVEGDEVTNAEEWYSVRRPQILSLFSNLIYGHTPKPQYPIQTEFDVVKTDAEFMNGKATRKDVKIRFSNEKGQKEMHVLVFVPNHADGPAPAFDEA